MSTKRYVIVIEGEGADDRHPPLKQEVYQGAVNMAERISHYHPGPKYRVVSFEEAADDQVR